MANAQAQNYALASAGHSFSGVWKLTRVMKAAGWTVFAHSDGVTKQAAGTNNNDSWGNNANPLLDTYPAFNTAQAWIGMEGPRTIKVPITAAPTGDFIRSEPVTQATSGATGELIGYVWDPAGATGWAVLAPRTGTFNGTDVITGGSSLATLTPSAAPRIFRRQVIFYKSTNTTDGTILYVCFDDASESASAFSVLAAAAGATAVIAPGCGGTGNAFPAIAQAIRGTGGSVSHATWVSITAPGSSAQICAANATPSAGVSPDGSFWCALSSSTVALTHLFGFTRMDDGEPGDCDPYLWFAPTAQTYASFSRTASTGFGSGGTGLVGGDFYSGSYYTYFKGNVARGCPVTARDITAPFYIALEVVQAGGEVAANSIAGSTTPRMANHPNASPPFPRTAFGLWTRNPTSPMRKGVPRWLVTTPTGNVYDTLDGKRFMVVFARDGFKMPGLAIGPMDGVTTTVQ